MPKSKHRKKTNNNTRRIRKMAAKAQAGAQKISSAVRRKLIAEANASDLPDKERGLYPRYEIRRLDGTPGKHNHCDFFVLDLNHDQHAAPALLSYAMSARADGFELLADDLLSKIQPYVQQLNEQAASGAVDVLTDIENSTDADLFTAGMNIYLDMPAGTYESQVLKELLARFKPIITVAEPRPEEPVAEVKPKRKYNRKFGTPSEQGKEKAKATRKKKNETATDTAA